MILLSDYEKKLVIPRWLNFAKAAKTTELSYPTKKPFVVSESTKKRLAADYSDFQSQPTDHKAADLMGSAFVIGNELIAKETAQYVKKSNVLQNPVQDLANHILGRHRKVEVPEDVKIRIAKNKKFLNEYPHNAFAWIERARCYTILGLVEKAEKCVRIALSLAPADRFIVRSSVRFFLHADKYEQAWDCVSRASEIKFDPWIKATEISVAEIIEKSVKKLKGLVPTGATPDNIFHYSELIESYGMLELINGNDSRAKKFFKLAWSNPSHNVITHSEWIVRERFPSLTEIVKDNFAESIEATAWQKYHNMEVDEALRAAIEWGLEEPYAKNAFGLGSGLAFRKRDFSQGVKIVTKGLKASPNDFGLQNNLCFGLLRMNKPHEAEKEFTKITPPTNKDSLVVYTATKGLLEYKKGNILKGRSLYLEAIENATALGNRQLMANAFINFAIAEIESKTEDAKEYAAAALKASEKFTDVSVKLTRGNLIDVLPELNRKKEELPFKEFHKPQIIPPKKD